MGRGWDCPHRLRRDVRQPDSELNEQYGAYSQREAALDHAIHMLNLKTDSMMELTYQERKRFLTT